MWALKCSLVVTDCRPCDCNAWVDQSIQFLYIFSRPYPLTYTRNHLVFIFLIYWYILFNKMLWLVRWKRIVHPRPPTHKVTRKIKRTKELRAKRCSEWRVKNVYICIYVCECAVCGFMCKNEWVKCMRLKVRNFFNRKKKYSFFIFYF